MPLSYLRGRVLVIDDEDDVRHSIVRHLERAGFDVLEVRNVIEALELLRSDGDIRVVLLDLMMPGLTGWQFREEQLRDPGIAKVPTIVLTGQNVERRDRQRLRVTDFLVKPVPPDLLIRVVGKYCRPLPRR